MGLAAALLCLVGARILALSITDLSLHYDEAQYWFWSHELAFGYFSKPPLLMWFIRGVTDICGDGQLCIRAPAAILHTATAAIVYVLARRLYDRRVAFWSAVAYATVPVISVLSMMLTTDAILLGTFAAALVVLDAHLRKPGLLTGLALGVLLGIGLNAKYSMIYLPACTALYLIATPSARGILRAPGTYVALAVAAAMIAPNLAWVASHNFITAEHTARIAGWTHPRLALDRTATFVAVQFAIFGPMFFFVLLRSLVVREEGPGSRSDRFLLFHSVPIVVAFVVLPLVFSAKYHWALPALPAVTVFAVARMLRRREMRALKYAVGVHTVFALALVAAAPFVAHLPWKDVRNLTGWRDFAANIRAAATRSDVDTVVLQHRDRVASALYELRDTNLAIRAVRPPGAPIEDDFELRRPWAYGDPGTVLLVTNAEPGAFGIPPDAVTEIATFTGVSIHGGRSYGAYKVRPPGEATAPAE